MRLLITRPEPDAARSAATLRQRGHEVVVAPLIRIEPVAADLGPGPWAAVLITSANALVGLRIQEQRETLIGLPLIAIGDRSAGAARMAGFADVTSASGAMGDLAALVRKRLVPDQRLLYLAGADRSGDLAAELRTAGLTVETQVVYRAIAAATLPAPAKAELAAGRIGGVLHYSRRTAEAFLVAAAADSLGAAALAPTHFCLSARIAAPLAAAGAVRIRIAPQPAERSLLHLLDSP